MASVVNANIKSVDYIVDAKTVHGSTRRYYEKEQEKILRTRGLVVKVNYDEIPSKHSVKARIFSGQLIADCECGGATLVSQEDGFFFCFNCLNRMDNGKIREVDFPPNMEEIKMELLRRPVNDIAGLDDWERAGRALPVIIVEGKGGLLRNWEPRETLEDLREQNKAVDKWNKELKK